MKDKDLMPLPPDELEFLKARYARARNKYKPSTIQTLIIAEAPPCTPERYFYFEEVRTHDSLFLEIMGVLYPEQKQRYLKSRRDPALKEELLEAFREDGFWLLDLSEVPPELEPVELKDCVPGLKKRLEQYIDKTTPVLLIKASVYDTCFAWLHEEGYHVKDLRLPFPGSGQQGVFRALFKKALED